MSPTPTIETAVRILNEALAADPTALTNLAGHRVNCNAALVDHPTVQVTQRSAEPNMPDWDQPCVGLLGILNGVLEPMTGKRVGMKWEDLQFPVGGRAFMGFCVYDPAAQAGAASAEASQ